MGVVVHGLGGLPEQNLTLRLLSHLLWPHTRLKMVSDIVLTRWTLNLRFAEAELKTRQLVPSLHFLLQRDDGSGPVAEEKLIK